VSVSWFDGVTITVEVAFAAGPLDTYQLDEFGELILDEDDLPIEIEWTDVSEYVRDIRIDRGRRDEFSQFGPSTASVTFDNRLRQFDPNYASGPFYGTLNPMRKIRIQATYNSVTYDRFVGFVQGWPQDYEFTFDSTVTVNCVDGTRFLASEELRSTAYESAVLADSPVAYWPMQEQSILRYEDTQASVGITPTINGVAQISTTLPLNGTTMAVADPALVTDSFGVTDSTISAVIADQGFSDVVGLEMWMFHRGAYTNALIAQTSSRNESDSFLWCGNTADGLLTVLYSNVADNRYILTTTTTVQLGRGKPIHLFIRATTSTIYVYVNGVEEWSAALSVGTSASSYTTPYVNVRFMRDTGTPEGSPMGISHVAVYTTAPSAVRVAEHYAAGVAAYGHPYGERSGDRIGRVLDEIGWPAADRTLGNGDTVHGPYTPNRQSAISYMQDVAVAEDGLLFIGRDGKVVLRDRQWQWTRSSAGTFSDDGADNTYEGVTIDANSIEPMRTAVSATYGANNAYLKVQDATAVTAYGPLLEPLSVPTVESAAQARALANYKLRTTKDPLTRITELRVQPRSKPATTYPVLLGLEIGDRIVVERTPGNPVVGSQIVQSVTVQGYSESITVEGVWLTSLYLSPAPTVATAAPYLLTNDATYGRTGAAAGNKVAF
jgi:hypothetical protein